MEAEYDERLRECKNESEMAEYLLSCIPTLREYMTEAKDEGATHHKSSVNLQIKSRKGVARNDIYKKYLQDVEGQIEISEFKVDACVFPCTSCGKKFTKILDETTSDEICRECGAVEFIQSDEAGYKEEQEHEKTIVYSYKRENHFNEWVSQFQAKEWCHWEIESRIQKAKTQGSIWNYTRKGEGFFEKAQLLEILRARPIYSDDDERHNTTDNVTGARG